MYNHLPEGTRLDMALNITKYLRTETNENESNEREYLKTAGEYDHGFSMKIHQRLSCFRSSKIKTPADKSVTENSKL